jgi:hypothetical protein
MSVLVGWACAVAIVALHTIRTRGRPAWRNSVPVQLTAAGIVAALVALLLPGFMTELLARSTGIPFWAKSSPAPALGYAQWIAASLPVVTALSVVSFPLVLVRRPWLGMFLLCWFAVPIAIHTALPFRQERYVLAAMPGLFVATGYAAAVLLGALRRWTRARLASMRGRPDNRSVLAETGGMLAVLAVVTGAAFSMPAVRTALDPDRDETPAWELARAVLDGVPGQSALPLGSTSPLAAMFYLGRIDFVVSKSSLETWVERGRPLPDGPAAGRSGYHMRAEGAPDEYTGARVLTTPAAIASHYPDGHTVLVLIERRFITFDNLDPALEAELAAHGDELCRGRCGDILFYRWVSRVEPAGAASARTTAPAAYAVVDPG